MYQLLFILIDLVITTIVSLYSGKVTITNKTISIDRPFIFVGTLLLMLGAMFWFIGIRNEILKR